MAFALRWWWLILIGLVIGCVGAVGYHKYGPTPYTSTALVQVVPQSASVNPSAQAAPASDIVTNYAAEAASEPMMAMVAQALAQVKVNLSAADLATMMNSASLVVDQPSNGASFIQITVTDTNPARAMLIANTYAKVVVGDVNAIAGQQLKATTQLLQQQINDTHQRLVTAQLFQRQSDLTSQLQSQRTTLLNTESSYQSQLISEQQITSGQVKLPPGYTPVQTLWLQTLSEQITQLQADIKSTTAELNSVNAQLAKLSPPPDPITSAAFASAYQTQLTSLTNEYAQLQLQEQNAAAPVSLYGQASYPLAATALKTTLMEGAVLGAAVGIGLGFGFDMLKKRRRGKPAESSAMIEAVGTSSIEREQASEMAGVAAMPGSFGANGHVPQPGSGERDAESVDDVLSRRRSAYRWPKKL